LKSISVITGALLLFWSCGKSTNETTGSKSQELDKDFLEFLEIFAAEIEDYVTVLAQIEQGESDFNIILKRKNLEQNVQSYSSGPTFFKCSSSLTFSVQM